MTKFTLKTDIGTGTRGTVCDFLAAESGISKGKIKDAMNKGAVWMRRKKGGKLLRIRKATASLFPGNHVEFHYDERLLSLKPPEAKCLDDLGRYSVWYKPPGLMSQGTPFGDHCSLLREAELFFSPRREVFLVHRLDREASGIMLIAHDSAAAAKLSGLFRENLVIKRYRAMVLGDLSAREPGGVIELSLDGKKAVTEFEVKSYDPVNNMSTADVIIKTGRLHQIRRHFEMIGFPVIGDPHYGKGNKNTGGMMLFAFSLSFRCPISAREMEFTLPDQLIRK